MVIGMYSSLGCLQKVGLIGSTVSGCTLCPIGKIELFDSVRITKTAPGKYQLRPGGLGDYEEFLDSEVTVTSKKD